ncbi:Mitochondrial transcription termination factor, mTERF [Phytophthora cinnamomi]|uniref:Mitochondrial transcription termination factor, mTERF n=1 Tax=Phytophthora cinnamomi TaxID=4785 RepID=UPI00355AC3A2|nr:Mitochondrial transcription termination factor, mTERF [Phytophthora cinnamomi]
MLRLATLQRQLRSPRPLQTLARSFTASPGKTEDGGRAERRLQAISYARISRKYPIHVGQLSMAAVDRTTRFLMDRGLSQTQALRVVALHVKMCQYTAGTMESKIEWLSNLGLSHDKINSAILRSPNILGMSFEKYEETVDWFISKGVPRDKIPYVFTVFPQGVSYKEETLDQKVDVLKEIGCDDAQIARILTMSPQMLSYGTESLQETVNLLTQLGVPAEKVPSILARVPQCLGLSLDRILETIDALDSMFGPGAGVRALTWNPIIVMHNISGLRRSFNYLVSIGFTKERLQRNTRLLTRSASRILRPRGQFLRSNGEDVVASIGWITMSERAFMEEYPDFKAYLTEHKRRPTKKTPSV